jgi:hypothetical protein
MNGTAHRPEEIESSIRQTRAEMDATLHALEERLTPGQLIDQGIDYLRHSGANEFVGNLGNSVKRNPVPVALVGIGLAWLMATNPNGPGERVEVRREGGDSRDSAAAEAWGTAREGLRSAGESVSQAASTARQRAGDIAQTARDRARQLRQGAGDTMERAKDRYDTLLREQPLVLGAIGVALGAMFAASLPRTRQEDRLMGGARDRFVDEASEAAADKLERASPTTNTASAPGSALADVPEMRIEPGAPGRPVEGQQSAG